MMPAYRLRVGEKLLSFDGSILLMDALRASGASLSMPCGGRGACGKCVVWVKGRTSDKSDAEAAFLRQHALADKPGFEKRLACMCHLLGDGEVIIPWMNVHSVSGAIGSLPSYDGDHQNSIGFAVDIGTTTIAIRLYSLREEKLLSSAVEMNEQSRFGADVLSRIDYSNANGAAALQQALLTQLSRMFKAVTRKAGCDAPVERVVFVGNTTMLHFLMGLDPRGIGVAPFQPQSLFGDTFSANDLFPHFPRDTEAYIPRCVSAYIGADITAGMLATGFDRPSLRLLVDVGTNGEMALQNEGRIICCATAAGPAFEGAQISMGMPAMDGAICKVFPCNGIGYQVIGATEPLGICGTGLISLLSLLKKEGALDETGLFDASSGLFRPYFQRVDGQKALMIGDSGVSLSMRDVRQVQLAKAAIAAGIETLLHEENIAAGDIPEFLLAGGFGSQMQASDAADIGLIPKECQGRAIAAGNVALHGASMMLLSKAHRGIADQMARKAVEKPLSSHPFFMERYIENMMF